MGSSCVGQRHCGCGTRLAADNTEYQCARCVRASRDKLIVPPEVPAEFWQTEPLRDAFMRQHMGRVARAYRLHPHHQSVYGLSGISQRLLGQWLGLTQAQISRIESGQPIRNLDTLVYWARTLRIPAELLWFRLPGDTARLTVVSSVGSQLTGVSSGSSLSDGYAGDPENDPVLVAPWSSRGTIEVAAVLKDGGGLVKRRGFVFLTGAVLTSPAHQWLIHEPGPLISGLSGRRISTRLVDQLAAMTVELRRMDDVAGGGSVLSQAQHQFDWVAGLLVKASYDERISRRLHIALAELGQLVGWAAYDAGQHGLAQRYYIAALRAAHSAGDQLLAAHILGCMAEQAARQGQPAAAVTLIESAVTGTRGCHTPNMLAVLYNRQAYAFATLGDASSCIMAISKARTQNDFLAPATEPSWLYWVNPANMTAEAGNCLRQLGRNGEAVAIFEDGLATFDDSLPRGRQGYLAGLAETLTRPGPQRDLDAAASRGMEAINLAEDLNSILSVARIRNLSQLLMPHVKMPAVQEFVDRAKVFVKAQA